MSQTGPWSQPETSNPSSSGPVTFYNPAEYQTAVSAPGAPAKSISNHISPSSGNQTSHNTVQGQFGSSGYNSWNWSGDWNRISEKPKPSSTVDTHSQDKNNSAKYEWSNQWDPNTNQLVSHQVLTNTSQPTSSAQQVSQANTQSLSQTWQSGQQVNQGHSATTTSAESNASQQWNQGGEQQQAEYWNQNQQQLNMPGVNLPSQSWDGNQSGEYSSQQQFWNPNQQVPTSGQQWDPNQQASLHGPQWDPNQQANLHGQQWDPNQQANSHGQQWDPNQQANSHGQQWDPNQQANFDGQQWDPNHLQTSGQLRPIEQTHVTHSNNPNQIDPTQHHWEDNSQIQWQGQVSSAQTNTTGQYQWYSSDSGNVNQLSNYYAPNDSGLTSSDVTTQKQTNNENSIETSHHLTQSQTGVSDSLNWSHGSNFSTASSNLDKSCNTSYASTVSASTNEMTETSGTEEVSETSYDEGAMSGFFNSDDCNVLQANNTQANIQPVKTEPSLQNTNLLRPECNFQRTDSSISNCSLQTVNFSRTNSALIETMANQLETVSLSETQPNVTNISNGDINSNLGLTTVNQSDTSGSECKGFDSNHSATEGQVSSHGVELKPSSSDTSSPDERISPPSSDWEMVPPQAPSGHSRNSSMSNSFYLGDASGEKNVHQDNNASLSTQVTSSNDGVDNSTEKTSASIINSTSSHSLTSLHKEGNSLHASDQPLSVFNSSSSPVEITNTSTIESNEVSNKQGNEIPTVDLSEPTIPAVRNNEKQVPDERPLSSSSGMEKVSHPRLDNIDNILHKSVTTHPSPILHSDASPFQPPIKLQHTDSIKTTKKDDIGKKSTTNKNEQSTSMSQIKRPQSSHINRLAQNMSPATTLWADTEISPMAGNIILAPAAPTVLPVQSVAVTTTSQTITTVNSAPSNSVSLSSQTVSSAPSTTKNSDKPSTAKKLLEKSKKNASDKKGKKRGSISENSNKSDDTNSLDGILDNDWPKADSSDNYYRRSRSPERSYSRNNPRDNSLNSEGKSESHSRERYREYGERYYSSNRPYSRADAEREDYYRSKDPRYHKDAYTERHADDRLYRPHSRQDNDDRVVRHIDRPRSRGEYDREYYSRDKERDRYRDYYYDYGRYRKPVYDDRDYQDLYYRYRKGYYDESGYYDKRSQADYYGQNNPALEDYERYSQISLSRGQSPGPDGIDRVDASNRDYTQGSRTSSRMGYDDYYNRSYYDYSNYYGYDYDQYYQESQERSKGRMTPQKYTIPHIKASFGPSGQIVTVLPNRPADGQPAVVQIQDINDLLKDSTATKEFSSYSGPLIRGETHKNDVLLFCQKKAKRCADNINLVDRESVQLIWKLLELLIKQNGTIIGTDIADLLLEGHEPTTVEYKTSGMKISESSDNLEEKDEDEMDNGGLDVTADRSIINKNKRDESTDRFRHLLLFGMKKDALEWAMKSNLWGHALFLASKMDNRTHANVMTRFANSAIRMNDPLQTLYQLMSGRQPAATTCISDENWGDWRPHLAMILSNHSNRPDIDRKSITTLGDTLASKGFLHASHFCYLMAQVNFGTFAKKTSKIVLIGSSHNLSLEEFMTNEAIQCTEIYEYAMSLGNKTFILPTFQCYKFLYACRLAEHGFAQEALHYCEVLSNNIQKSAGHYQGTFVNVLHNFADRLKHYDPQKLHESEEADDPQWLQQLQKISQRFESGSIQPISGSGTPMLYTTTTATSSESGEIAQLTGTPSGDVSTMQYQNEYGQICDSYGNLIEYSQNYGEENQQQYVGQFTSDQQYSEQQYNAAYNQYNQNKHGYTDNSQLQTHDQNAYTSQNIGYDNSALPENANQDNTAQEQPSSQFEQQPTDFNQYTQTQYQHVQTEQHQQQPSQELQHRGSLASTLSGGTTASESAQDDLEQSKSSSGFDYFSASTQKIVPPPSKFTEGPPSAQRIRTTSESSTGSVVRATTHKSHPQKKTNEPSKQTKQKKGWFGGWFGRSKNEMILPDDKNPSIVWDPVKKRWTNTDGDGIDEADAPPPPKDFELSAKPVVPSSQNAPGQSSESLPPTTGNKFSRPKIRGARNQYVDVLNTNSTTSLSSAASVPSNLFNVLPSDNPTPQNIFMPGSSSTNVKTNQESTRPKSASSKPTLVSYLEPPSTSNDLSRSSSMSSLSQEVQQLTKQEPSQSQVQEVNAPETTLNSTPAMFDPSQFHAKQKTTSGGRLSQKRIYPK